MNAANAVIQAENSLDELTPIALDYISAINSDTTRRALVAYLESEYVGDLPIYEVDAFNRLHHPNLGRVVTRIRGCQKAIARNTPLAGAALLAYA
jgi:hypothetical protein